MARGHFTLAAALLSTAIFAEFAGAQSRGTSGGGTTGGFGGSSMGGSTSGRGGTSSGTFGARSVGGAGGVPSANRSFRGTQPGQGVDATAGQVTGSERFLRQNRQAGEFVGGDSRDAVNLFSQSGGRTGQSGMTGLRTGQGNNSNRSNRQNEGGYGAQEGGGLYGRSNRPMLRPVLHVEFTHTTPPATTLLATLTKRLNRSSASALARVQWRLRLKSGRRFYEARLQQPMIAT